MTVHAPPLLYAISLWFVSTGVILWLDGLPRRTFRWSLAAVSGVALAALYGLYTSASDTSAFGAYMAFTCALAVWGWHEMTFLMGLITGPRRIPCPPDARGWRRFRYAAETLIYHELALALTAAGIAALTWGQPNQTGTLTFLLLLVMRVSTKLNIFIGVPNMSEEFLPDHLDYLKSYFRKKRFNWLFPVSVVASTWIAVLLARQAMGASVSGTAAETVGFTLLFALVALAILEHWFLVLPFADTALWRWAMSSRTTAKPDRVIYAAPATPATAGQQPRPTLASVGVGPAE